MKKIILASTSPRRKEIFALLNLPFDVVPSNFDEDTAKHTDPHELTTFLSQKKASVVAKQYPEAIIIGADTVVAYGNKNFSKPKDKTDAIHTLRLLSGTRHSVVTGITLIDTKTNTEITESVETFVEFRVLTNEEIEHYVELGESEGAAGSYKIQGPAAIFVKKIEGDYFNIVGLPIFRVSELLRNWGISIL